MNKIITLKDNITQETIYPITSTKAIITEDGRKFDDVMSQKYNEIEQALEEAIEMAYAAEESISSLTGLKNSSTALNEIDKLKDQVESTRLELVELKNKYRELNLISQKVLTTDDLTGKVTYEAGKIPTTTAVRTIITQAATDVMEYMIDTTSITPNYIPRDSGKILVNPDTNEVFISAGKDSNVWFKFNATTLILEESKINSYVDSGALYMSGDLKIEDRTITLKNNNGEVEDDAIIL